MSVTPRRELGFKGLVGLAVVQTGYPRTAALDLQQHLGQIPVRRRPRHQRHVGRALENLLPLLLRDAAENGKTFTLFLQLPELVQAMKNLLLRLIADGACVVKNETGFLLGVHLAVALREQCADDLFTVVKVHLAAEGLNVKRL